MTAPQSLSAERREEVMALWQDILDKDDRTSPAEYPDMALITFDEFAAAIDAQHAERPRAEIEKMRKAAILQIQAEAAATEDGETLESLNRVIERLRALSIEGTG